MSKPVRLVGFMLCHWVNSTSEKLPNVCGTLVQLSVSVALYQAVQSETVQLGSGDGRPGQEKTAGLDRYA